MCPLENERTHNDEKQQISFMRNNAKKSTCTTLAKTGLKRVSADIQYVQRSDHTELWIPESILKQTSS